MSRPRSRKSRKSAASRRRSGSKSSGRQEPTLAFVIAVAASLLVVILAVQNNRLSKELAVPKPGLIEPKRPVQQRKKTESEKQVSAQPVKPPVPVIAEPVIPAVPAYPKGSGRIAIVLDDWGYHASQTGYFESIPAPLTIAVLPHLPYSQIVARQAAANGHEVILHMPMEAQGVVLEEDRVIESGMSAQQVLTYLQNALDSVPGARGVNNHQGSRATTDPVLLKTVFTEIRNRKLYFLDSFVTAQSVGRTVAAQVQIPFARRSVFLDNEMEAEEIRDRIRELAQAANKRGSAIGIGHDRSLTLSVLAQEVPKLQAAGYRFVTVSKLVKVPKQ